MIGAQSCLMSLRETYVGMDVSVTLEQGRPDRNQSTAWLGAQKEEGPPDFGNESSDCSHRRLGQYLYRSDMYQLAPFPNQFFSRYVVGIDPDAEGMSGQALSACRFPPKAQAVW